MQSRTHSCLRRRICGNIIITIITIAIGHHRHRIAIAIVATMLLSYQLHYDIIIRVYYYTIVLSYYVIPRACPRHA